jgi:hypothetical protein
MERKRKGRTMNPMAWSREAWDASISAKAYHADWWDTLTPEKAPALWAEVGQIACFRVRAAS